MDHIVTRKSIIFYQESDLDAGLVGASSRDTRYSPGIVLVQSCYSEVLQRNSPKMCKHTFSTLKPICKMFNGHN